MSAVVPPGYKQTEVGVIPEDWGTESIGALFEISVGRDLEKEYFAESYDQKHPYPIYANAHSQDGLYGYSEVYRYEGNKITVTARGDVGSAVYRGQSFCAIGRLLVLSPKRDYEPRFFAEFIDNYVHFALESTGVPQLTAPQISKYAVAVPPTKLEQQRIAKTLSDADALIEGLEQLISKKLEVKQGAMQELLSPEENWKLISLGNLANPHKQWSFTGGPFGSNLKSSDYTDEGVRIIQLQNIGDGKFKNNYEIYTSVKKADELLSCNIYPGDIILSKMGDPVARACIIPALHERYLMCSDGIRLAVDKELFNSYFVYTVINAPEFRAKAENAGTGSTRKRIGLTELRALEILLPSLEEQTEIAMILSDMDAEIAGLEVKLDKARRVKEGMMQDLLTGKVRLV